MTTKARIAKIEKKVNQKEAAKIEVFWTLWDGTCQNAETGEILTEQELESRGNVIYLKWHEHGEETP
jgi:hypothetical protein